jgi:hypothetical protein
MKQNKESLKHINCLRCSITQNVSKVWYIYMYYAELKPEIRSAYTVRPIACALRTAHSFLLSSFDGVVLFESSFLKDVSVL